MFTLPNLPYAEDALAPHVSAETMSFHHGKHHRKYVDTLNELLEGNPLADRSLEDVILQSHQRPEQKKIFNNAAQSWNHDFLWKSMSPDGGGAPVGAVKDAIERDFGDAAAFAEAFEKAATDHFGSGWAWLVATAHGRVEITTTHDADLPLVHGQTALLTCDLWEHAYYLDRQNRRPEYLKAFLGNLINWEFANSNLNAVSSG
jgi:superoxide dismutase, Fe-Mn family